MMHLASSAQTPTIGLFKFDNLIRYEPYNNKSIAIDTNNDAIEDWIKATNKILQKN
jgi:ADP-heptose:LPS heptosyltransferase